MESGCLALAEGNLQLALSELKLSLDQFQIGKLTVEAEWCRVWLAAATATSGDKATARIHLQFVLSALSHESGDSPLVHMIRHATPWLIELQSDQETARQLSR